ncbi:MAG: helix-turn-helix domain-containing protein [Pseudomonadota bacterium]
MGARPSRRNGRGGEYRGDELGLAAKAFAHPEVDPDGAADAANDFGVCWPSVSTVATKCCVSIRTVRRVMQKLVDRRLLLSEQRYRKDGSCSSSWYRLRLEGGDRLSPAPDPCDTTPGHPCEAPPVTGDIPGTTIGTQKEPLPPRGAATCVAVSNSVESGGGDFSELEYPTVLSAAEQEEARKKLAGIPAGLSQQLLDELAASIKANVIQLTPLAYLRGLITRARAGTFTPEGALRIANHREQQARVDAVMRRSNGMTRDYPPDEVDPDNPLVRKLLDIQSRMQERKRHED